MDFTRKLQKSGKRGEITSFHGIFIPYLLLHSLSLDYLHNQFLVIPMQRQIRVVVYS